MLTGVFLLVIVDFAQKLKESISFLLDVGLFLAEELVHLGDELIRLSVDVTHVHYFNNKIYLTPKIKME